MVLLEPDRPINFFSLGPRVFIPARDLASLDLVGKGSRVNYTILVKVMDQKDLDTIAAPAQGRFPAGPRTGRDLPDRRVGSKALL